MSKKKQMSATEAGSRCGELAPRQRCHPREELRTEDREPTGRNGEHVRTKGAENMMEV